MELIIAIAIVAIGVAIWFNRKKPEAPKVEAETFSDNGIKFTAPKEEAPAPVAEVVETPAAEVKPAKKPRAKKPAVVAKTATTARKAAAAKKAPAKPRKPKTV